MSKVIRLTGVTCSYCDRWKYLSKRKVEKAVFRLCPFNPEGKGEEIEMDSDDSICERFKIAD
ncbi:hypothetical protein LCGC14_1810290, partial [marine sediment metagenome]